MQIEVVGVKFKSSNNIYSFNPNGLDVKVGDYVIVDTEKGSEMGKVFKTKESVDPSTLSSPLKNVLKIATKEMVEKAEEYDKQAQTYYSEIKKLVKEENLDMKIVKIH